VRDKRRKHPVRQFSTTAEDKSRQIVFIALFTNVAIAVSKLVAALITGSSAMLAEAAHTVADSGNEISLLLGEAASPETLQRIVQTVRRVPEVVEIVELLTMHLAPDDILVNME
jgi:divalent metal cation (Fe/Co/Zn/Cd) transporter